jgi:PAS domain S-box-containing protein
MPQSFQVDDTRASLRQRALAKLTVSTLANPKRASMSDALAVLHHLASSPSTASDALALLHELQVHQVELDLQQDELQGSRAELETALSRQTALVERAPVGYMTIDAATVLSEINLAGAHLLGAARTELMGRPLARWLSAPSADALRTLLSRAHDGQVPETCNLQLRPGAGGTRTVHAAVSKDSDSDHFLLVLMAAAQADQADTA